MGRIRAGKNWCFHAIASCLVPSSLADALLRPSQEQGRKALVWCWQAGFYRMEFLFPAKGVIYGMALFVVKTLATFVTLCRMI